MCNAVSYFCRNAENPPKVLLLDYFNTSYPDYATYKGWELKVGEREREGERESERRKEREKKINVRKTACKETYHNYHVNEHDGLANHKGYGKNTSVCEFRWIITTRVSPTRPHTTDESSRYLDL